MSATSSPRVEYWPAQCGSALLVALTLLAGCATPPDLRQTPLRHWTQLGADGTSNLRAIVAAGDDCPKAIVDGEARPLLLRAGATPAHAPARDNAAFDPDFAVNACELELPRSAQQASIAGEAVALPRNRTRRIVVIGDTGCRIKVPADSPGDPIQDCSDSTTWPWPKIALAAARTQPDLVIHLGDFHYREYCANPALCSVVAERGTVVGYGWPGWNADFFTPAAPLLAAAPWVLVRGNHENCDRGGEGWMRFLSPVPYQRCANQVYKTASRSLLANNLTADAYRIDLDGGLRLVVADNAGHEDYRLASGTPDDVAILRDKLAALLTVPEAPAVWLLLHRPIWYDLLTAVSQPNALQVVLAGKLPGNVQFAFAGHEHAFQTINFARAADRVNYPTGRPAQVLVGASGTQLEALDPQSPLYEGEVGVGGKERVRPDGRLYDGVPAAGGIVLNRYSFLLLERDENGWAAILLDADGQVMSRCRLFGENKAIVCSFPAG